MLTNMHTYSPLWIRTRNSTTLEHLQGIEQVDPKVTTSISLSTDISTTTECEHLCLSRELLVLNPSGQVLPYELLLVYI